MFLDLMFYDIVRYLNFYAYYNAPISRLLVRLPNVISFFFNVFKTYSYTSFSKISQF